MVFTTLALSRLGPAAPTLDRATIWTDTVQRGPLLRQVRGPGNLVPEQIRYIATLTPGRVERVLLRPGTEVEEGTVLLSLNCKGRKGWPATQTLHPLLATGHQREERRVGSPPSSFVLFPAFAV